VNIIEQLIIFGGGIFAGILGGLLGIGGGIVLMPILRFFVGLSPAFAAGTCILAVFFTTLGGSFRHYKLGHVKIKPLLSVIIAGAIFTLVFSLIFLYLAKKGKWLDLGGGLVFSFVSIRMIIEGSVDLLRKKIKEESRESEIQGPLLGKVIIGGMAGILPGLFGIGTGAILVPAFTLILKAPIKIAIGSSLTCFSVNAFFSALLKYFQGFVYLPVALPICLGTVIGSNIGAVLNKRFPSSVLKILFGIAFSYVSYQYILIFFQARS
jgi:uncharacterized membrane protein YfcA